MLTYIWIVQIQWIHGLTGTNNANIFHWRVFPATELHFGFERVAMIIACIINLYFSECNFEVWSTPLAPLGPSPVVHGGAPEPPVENGGPPPSLAGRGRASQLSRPGWLRAGEASCSTGAVPSHFHFIYLPPPPRKPPSLPSLDPSIPSSFLFLPLPVDQHSLHAELHCAQSAVAEQMASLCFFTLFLIDSESLTALICLFLSGIDTHCWSHLFLFFWINRHFCQSLFALLCQASIFSGIDKSVYYFSSRRFTSDLRAGWRFLVIKMITEVMQEIKKSKGN